MHTHLLGTTKDQNPKSPKVFNPVMKSHVFIFLVLSFAYGFSKPDIRTGYRVTLEVPVVYNSGFIGRAFLMETNQMEPNFRTALSIVPIDGRYSCSLEVFLGDVRVWNSGHYSQFFTSGKCVIELTKDGDLQLQGPKERIGWRTGTSGQGVERLQILKTGNLVLVDALNRIKWQSFNFPTDVMLWGQRLNVATRLTSFPTNSSLFYTLEIQHRKIGLYLVSGKSNYSYWEFKPSRNRNITFVQLGARGLLVFNDEHRKIAQIPSNTIRPLRFLALGNRTGNLGLYFYAPEKGSFQTAFQALNTTCDLPLSCKPYGICTFSNACSCIRLLTNENRVNPDCGQENPEGFCGEHVQVEMLELNGVSSVLRDAPRRANVSKEECAKSCVEDCKCAAALYATRDGDVNLRDCFLYRLVAGVKQVDAGTGLVYMVKVPKGSRVSHGKSGVKKWVLVMVGVVDGLIIVLVFGGLSYYLIRRRKSDLAAATIDNT